MRLTRREFGGLAAGSLGGLMLPRTAEAAGPLSDMPAGAIDVHNHIVRPLPKYPMAPNRTYTPPEASVAQLRALRTQLGVVGKRHRLTSACSRRRTGASRCAAAEAER